MSKLYIVATPIGNLSDITLRALETLKSVDIIACEDTRHTLTLLNHYGIKKPLVSYYKHKEREGSIAIAEAVESGKDVALVSDAGMPIISDPGSTLIAEFRKRNLSYTVIPGANAAVSAAALAGIDGPFTFLGFLPEKRKDREIIISKHAETGAYLILYTAPHDLNGLLDDLIILLGDRKGYTVKEITKMFERVSEGKLSELKEDNPKGEYVLIICPEEKNSLTDDEIAAALKSLLSKGVDKKNAVATVSEKYSVGKNRVYKISLNL